MFESSKWICANDHRAWRHPPVGEPYPSPYIIKDFEVAEGVERVILNVCGLGQAAYFVNGEPADGTVRPTHVSDYHMSAIYNEIDITSRVRVGKNRFGAILGHAYFADPENMHRMTVPRMIAEIDIEYASGKRETVASDTSFKTLPSPYLFSLRRCGERYDAKRETVGWCLPETDTSAWENAYICSGPGGRLRPTKCPPKRVFEVIEGKKISDTVFDFGENLSGWVRFTLHSVNEEKITVIYSEWLDESGKHVTHEGLQAGVYPDMLHKDVYFPAGRVGENFEPLFTYHGFRYVEIIGAADVTAVAMKVHTDIAPLASFSCDNEILNGIRAACDRSILACAQDTMVDCPQREQNEWTGDGMLTAEVVSMEYDSYGMFYEWMEKFKDAQYPSGYLPSIIPCRSNWPHNFANGLDWSSAIIHIPYYAYKYSGDDSIVRSTFANMVKAMEYFATMSENCLMSFGVGDWVSLDPMCDVEITDTVYYRVDALMMAELAEKIGEDAERWYRLAEDIKRDFRDKYVKDGRLTVDTFTPLAVSVWGGMLEADEIKHHVSLAAKIAREQGDALRCGIHGLRAVFDVFGKYGYNDLIFRILTNTSAKGYGKSVKDGLTTLPESFDYHCRENENGKYYSLDHHFTAMVDGWFYRYVAGIGLSGFGWDSLYIAPKIIDEIRNFSAECRGVCVERRENELKIISPYAFKLELGENSGEYAAGEYVFTL